MYFAFWIFNSSIYLDRLEIEFCVENGIILNIWTTDTRATTIWRFGKIRQNQAMSKIVGTLKLYNFGVPHSNVKCLTIFPHKIQLPVDLNQFQIRIFWVDKRIMNDIFAFALSGCVCFMRKIMHPLDSTSYSLSLDGEKRTEDYPPEMR